MKRLLAIGAVSVLGALTIASAAALNVNGGAVQAGSDITLTCDTDAPGVDVSYAVGFVGGEYKITAVTVSGIDVETTTTPETCIGRQLSVQLTDGGVAVGASLPVTIAAASETITLTTTASAELTDDVHVAIH